MPVRAQAGNRCVRRGPAWRFLVTSLAAGLCLLLQPSCNRDFSDPPGTAPDGDDTTGTAQDTAGLDKSGQDTVKPPPRPDSLAARDLSLTAGDDPASPNLTWYPANFSDKRIQLISDNAAVAKVESGRIRPLAAGTAQITVITEAGRLIARFEVTVKARPGPVDTVIHVISVSAASMSLYVGEEARPELSWNPPGADDKSFSLSTRDADKAEIRGDRVFARAAGSAQILVTARDGGRTATFTVTIAERDTRIRVLSLSAEDLDLPVGAEAEPRLAWIPSDATVKTYLLTSADPEVASVAGTRLRAHKPGSTVILVQSLDDAAKTAAFKVHVSVPTRSVSAEDMTLSAGGPDAEPRLAWTPSDATDKGFVLSATPAANPAATAVDNKVRPLRPGAITFTVTPTGGAAPASFRVTVLSRLNSLSAADTLVEEDARDVVPRIHWNPPDVEDKSYSLSTPDPAVSVDGLLFSAAAVGQARVTVTASEGGLQASFRVTVVQKGCAAAMERRGGGAEAAEQRRCCQETWKLCPIQDPPPVVPPPVIPPPYDPPPPADTIAPPADTVVVVDTAVPPVIPPLDPPADTAAVTPPDTTAAPDTPAVGRSGRSFPVPELGGIGLVGFPACVTQRSASPRILSGRTTTVSRVSTRSFRSPGLSIR